jgi:uncharacterized membrane protein YkvA (DUF1232 family)
MCAHEKEYDDRSFWEKIRRFAIKAGRPVVENALVLYFCLKDADTPGRAKVVVIGALGYFILPIDAVPDLIPVAGFTDDLAVLLIATTTVVAHIKPAHRQRARELLDWERNTKGAESLGDDGWRAKGQRTFSSDAEKERYYMNTLELSGDITASVLKDRYRELAHKYHPDKVQHLGTEFQQMAGHKLKEINAAYEYLKKKYG